VGVAEALHSDRAAAALARCRTPGQNPDRSIVPQRRPGSELLICGPDQDLVYGDAPGARDDVRDGVCDVGRLESFDVPEPLGDLLLDLGTVVGRELGRYSPGLDQGDAHVPASDLQGYDIHRNPAGSGAGASGLAGSPSGGSFWLYSTGARSFGVSG